MPVYVHGVPNNSDDWLPFLERTGGFAPDLPGFGRSAKPADFDYSIEGYAGFLDAFLDARGLDRFSLVVHDWGAVGLALRSSAPERLERLVVIERACRSCPATAGTASRGSGARPCWASWPWAPPAVRVEAARDARRNVTPGPMPDEFLDSDLGALRPRHPARDPQALPLGAGGRARDARRRPRPICAAWRWWPGATQDPYIPAEFARTYADALGGPVKHRSNSDDAGHWPWFDRPDPWTGSPSSSWPRAPKLQRL